MTRSDNLAGAAWMTMAMFGYVVNDGLIKRVAEELPLFQSVLIRGLCIVALLSVLVRVRGTSVPLRTYRQPALVLRISMETIGTIVYLITLTKVPLASLTAILQLVPVAVTFAAARMLHERLSLIRVGAVLAGFVGVLFIIRPGSDDFSAWYLGGVIAVGIIVVRELATRRIPATIGGLAVAWGTAVAITTMGAAVSVFEGWIAPEPWHIGMLLAAGGFLSLGYVGSVNAVRVGDLGFSAPFRYSIMVFAIIMQIVVFGDVPDALTFIGVAIIAAAGLGALGAERTGRCATPKS